MARIGERKRLITGNGSFKMSVGKLCNVDDDDFEVLFKAFCLDLTEREDYFKLSISEVVWEGTK